MRKITLLLGIFVIGSDAIAQDSPAITSWLQNTTETGSYYTSGNSTPVDNGVLVNCQEVSYSNDYVYVKTNGVPAYPTGPFMDGNPSQAEAQDAIFKFPLNPQIENGTPTATTMGTVGVFINGASLYDYRDGVAWDGSGLCGGPGNSPCPGGPSATMDWNRDAIPAEMEGFDCSKGHPAMGQYHHHQNPSAFKLDVDVVSSVCNLYDADGLYAINASEHSPLIGFAYDGFPIYGAYGYANTDGTGGIVRIKSSYELGTNTDRSTYPDGSTPGTAGPDFDETYFRGYFREDYLYVDHSADQDYVDEHNGRFCVTPEYPQGTYAYFCTVDEDWNSAYPYAVGPTFYGVYSNCSVSSINESVTVYDGMTTSENISVEEMNFNIFPNPATDLIAMQVSGVLKSDLYVNLFDANGRLIQNSTIKKGSTIAYFDIQTVYDGIYFLKISDGKNTRSETVVVQRD